VLQIIVVKGNLTYDIDNRDRVARVMDLFKDGLGKESKQGVIGDANDTEYQPDSDES
jgi:hypothetical protein